MSQKNANEHAPTLQELYPELDDEEVKEARANIRGYLAVLLRIHDRLERKSATENLTAADTDAAMETERSDQS